MNSKQQYVDFNARAVETEHRGTVAFWNADGLFTNDYQQVYLYKESHNEHQRTGTYATEDFEIVKTMKTRELQHVGRATRRPEKRSALQSIVQDETVRNKGPVEDLESLDRTTSGGGCSTTHLRYHMHSERPSVEIERITRLL